MAISVISKGRKTEQSISEHRRSRAARWADLVLCLVAVLGLGSTLLADFQRVRTLDYVATDFKTVYASAALFREGADPYDPSAFKRIYRRDGVVTPKSTFGRMPVYPPVSLLLLWPLTYMPMGASAVAWWMLSMLAVAAGAAVLLGLARQLQLDWIYRVTLLAFIACSPMLAFALNIGNVSPVVGALCTIAMVIGAGEWQTLSASVAGAVSLGLALCLKPHLAVWVAAGLALVCGKLGRHIAAGALGLFGFCAVVSAIVLWSRGLLGIVLGSLMQMLAHERASGSMSPRSREVLPVVGQITALNSLLGLGVAQPLRARMVGVGLAILLGALAFVAWRSGWGKQNLEWRLLFLSALIAVGMVASYHRAHDAVLLAGTVGLWICTAVRRMLTGGHRRWVYWGGSAAILGTFAGQWFRLPSWAWERAASLPHAGRLTELLALRQGALFALCLAGLLAVISWLSEQKKTARTV